MKVQMDGLLTVPEVARLMRVTGGAVRTWIRAGRLKSIRTPGGFYRITQEAAESLMREELAQPTDGKAA